MSDGLSLIEALLRDHSADSGELPEAIGAANATSANMQIGRFEVSDLLGEGAFGFVFRAFDPFCKRPCALKVPKPDVLGNTRKRQRFLSDAVAMARLGHPNVVQVYEADECGGICYIAMELCESGSLADWRNGLPEGAVIPTDWATELVRQIADGVQHVHERRIYHRDLKPANILLVPAEDDPTPRRAGNVAAPGFPRFRAKVGDFGLAKVLDHADRTVAGALVGTMPYMAPEQIRGDSASVGPATDVWALGVILYQLLTGCLPFGTAEDPWLERKICNESPLAPRTLRKDVSHGLQRVCLTCLEKDPGDRYRTARELAFQLDRVLEGLQPIGTPSWKRLARWVIKRVKRYPLRAAALVVTVLALGVAVWLTDYVRRRDLELMLRDFEVKAPADLATWVPRLDPKSRTVVNFLRSLFVTGAPDQRIASALVLGEKEPDYADYCYKWLLDGDASKLRPVAELLNARMPGLEARLETVVDHSPPADATASERETHDRRRANAACALILLGPGERGWSLLRFNADDPQARSFLIHLMGPAGVDPQQVFARLNNPATETSVRRALIQSLHGITAEAWAARSDLRGKVTDYLLERYANDPDSGIHGSAKWLLRRWGHGARLDWIDHVLAGKTCEGFQWRISKELLTLITIDDPALDRVIEVSDTEITVALYLRFRREAEFERGVSPEATCPINGVSYFDAVGFCNWLGIREGLPAIYQEINTAKATHVPVARHVDLGGLRLPTNEEFGVICAAGTKTRRFHGDSDALFDQYAWIMPTSGGKACPVASLIPNEIGIFDALGNVQEWCEPSVERGPPWRADARGGWSSYFPSSELDRFTVVEDLPLDRPNPTLGLRVVRTKLERAR
jgi:serine/threonine protein kinase